VLAGEAHDRADDDLDLERPPVLDVQQHRPLVRGPVDDELGSVVSAEIFVVHIPDLAPTLTRS
jgi:hypothetical protein